MAISTTDDPVIIEIVETYAATMPGEEELTQELKDQTAVMLEQCFEHRDQTVLEKATKSFTESIVYFHKMLSLQEEVHHSQLPSDGITPEGAEAIKRTRRKINDTVHNYLRRQLRHFTTFLS